MDAIVQWVIGNATGFIQWFGGLFTASEWKVEEGGFIRRVR